MNEEDRCNTTLGLGNEVEVKREKQLKQNKRGLWLDLSLPVLQQKIEGSDYDHKYEEEKDDQDSISSKTFDDQEEEEEEEAAARVIKRSVSSNVDFCTHKNNDGSRKKLKLTTEQISLLEDSFKSHSTLNMVHACSFPYNQSRFNF